MKIEVEVPDWAARARIWILSETEPVAYKEKDGDWYVKTGRCSMCGRCCLEVGNRNPFDHDPHCAYLVEETDDSGRMRCKLGIFRPMQCSIANRPTEGCTVKYERQ